MDFKVSIIVPIYNAEKYLSNCIDSILHQTYKNIEIILVNDGSTDSSIEICEEYAEKDKRIIIINKKNAGVSSTRNDGISISTGEYIQFVDCDDYIEYNMTEKLVEQMKTNADLVICGYKSVYIGKKNSTIENHISPVIGQYKKNEVVNYLGELFKNYFINPIWNKLYNTNIIRSHNLRFIEDINMGEDLLFNLEYISACSSIKIINESLYHYLNFNNGSLTASYKKNLFINQKMLFSKVREFLIENNYYTETNKKYIEVSYTDSVVGCLENLFHSQSNLTSKIRKENIRKIIYDDSVLKNITYFKNGNIQKQIIAFFIKYKFIQGVNLYFKIKKNAKNYINPLFNIMKKINNV